MEKKTLLPTRQSRPISKVDVIEYVNMKTFKNSYGVIVKFGNRKKETARVPHIFSRYSTALKMANDLKFLIGIPFIKVFDDVAVRQVFDKYATKAKNRKKKLNQ